jgi:hypothetical protein
METPTPQLAVLSTILQVIPMTLLQVLAVMMTITVDKYIQHKPWSQKSVQDIMFKDSFNLTLVNSILGYFHFNITLLWIDHPAELVFTLQRCISRHFAISVLILWNLAQITKIIPKMSSKLGNLLMNIQGTTNFLAASTECSAGSNDHFVGGGAVPSLVQFDGWPLGCANFQY